MPDLSMFAVTPRHPGRPSFDEIRAAARGRWLAILSEIIGDDYLSGKNRPCPGCGGADRFQFNRRSEAGAFSCRAHPDGGGDGFALIQHATDCDFVTAARMVSDALGLSETRRGYQPVTALPIAPPAPAADWLRAKAKAEAIWHTAKSITPDDAAGRYLLRRGLRLPGDANALRFHGALDYWTQGEDGQPEFIAKLPAMVARIVQPDGMGAGLHRIYLEPDGQKFAVDGLASKKIYKAGELTGAAVRLAMPTDDRIAIAEGIETALAFSLLSGVCTWAALSASLMPAVWLPDTARRIYIAADNDEAGQRAAHRLAERLLEEGRAVWINTPPTGNDWNDHLLTMREVRHAA